MKILQILGFALFAALSNSSIVSAVVAAPVQINPVVQEKNTTIDALPAFDPNLHYVVDKTGKAEVNIASLVEYYHQRDPRGGNVADSNVLLVPLLEKALNQNGSAGDQTSANLQDLLRQEGKLNDDFVRFFLPKSEEPVPSVNLHFDDIKVQSYNRSEYGIDMDYYTAVGEISLRLGSNHTITLGQLFSLIQKQGHGEPGVLKTDGNGNLAYIKDKYNTEALVAVYWGPFGGWYIESHNLTDTLDSDRDSMGIANMQVILPDTSAVASP